LPPSDNSIAVNNNNNNNNNNNVTICHSEDKDNMIVRNFSNYLPIDMA